METNHGRILPTKVLVKEIKSTEEKKTQSGIIMVSTQRNVPTKGEVLLTGEGTSYLPMTVKEGDTVLFTPLSGQRFTLNDEEVILLDHATLLYIIPK
jgi:chaperonin GroES